eukprot:CAMPEP_0113679428 /NCGR_PEP_ID=MMETSP0038_2-20120614/10630_1 /TAXON_ID=2898 /ORGANISM="Cryptomonas paramecium" /LENGTH=92 /DNA_ID=CAMNT_0000597441 /DNA_START=21 /DNA_END=299 /DNA_ORIENTATION=- /assembly_acc=CAM_ASM_000170
MRFAVPVARRVITRVQTLAPIRGGHGDHHDDHAHIPYENHHLTAAAHPGRKGADWGTGYFPVGNKAGIAAGLAGIFFGSAGLVLWSCGRQLK